MLILLVCAELYFRATSPHIIRHGAEGVSGDITQGNFSFFIDSARGRRLIPNSHVTIFNPRRNANVSININSHGFRGEDFPLVKDERETRILVLGDSITLAAGLPYEYGYVSEIERRLGDSFSERKIRLINAGIDGIGTRDQIDILEELGLAVSPDIVVVSYYLNDANPPDRTAAILGGAGFIRKNSVLVQTIYRTIKLRQYRNGEVPEAHMYDWLQIRPPEDWKSNPESFAKFIEIAGQDWGSAWTSEATDKIDRQFSRLNSLAAEHDFMVLIAAFPVRFQVETEFLDDRPQRRLKELSEKHGFKFIDLLPAFRERNNPGYLFNDWCHLSVPGHQIAADTLAGQIERHLLTAGREQKQSHKSPAPVPALY